MVQQEFPWATVPRRVSFPLIQNKTDRICASYCLSRRKALQLPTQSFASAIAKLCIRHRNALREKRLARKNYNENQNEDKNHDKPLEEDGGRALLSGFRFGLIRAVLLTPQA